MIDLHTQQTLPIIMGWFIRMHYKTTKNAFKRMRIYKGIEPVLSRIRDKVLSSPYYYMYPDIKMKSHGWDMEKDRGDIIKMISKAYDDFVLVAGKLMKKYGSKTDFVRTEKDENVIAVNVGVLSHLIADLHTIGQISSRYWGKVDDRIDFWSEWCRASNSGKHNMRYLTEEELLEELHEEIIDTYNTWHKSADKWKKCVFRRWCWLGPWRLRSYVKRQTARSSEYIAKVLIAAILDAEEVSVGRKKLTPPKPKGEKNVRTLKKKTN